MSLAPYTRAKAARQERQAGHDEKRRKMMADLERKEKGWEAARTQVGGNRWVWPQGSVLCLSQPESSVQTKGRGVHLCGRCTEGAAGSCQCELSPRHPAALQYAALCALLLAAGGDSEGQAAG